MNISPPWYAYTCPASSIARGSWGAPTICNVAFLSFLKLTITELHLQVGIVFHHTNANNSQCHIKTRSKLVAVHWNSEECVLLALRFMCGQISRSCRKLACYLLRWIQFFFLEGGNGTNSTRQSFRTPMARTLDSQLKLSP